MSVTGEGFTGVVVDGYIRDATVYLDTNASFIQDGDEQATTSDAQGLLHSGKWMPIWSPAMGLMLIPITP